MLVKLAGSESHGSCRCARMCPTRSATEVMESTEDLGRYPALSLGRRGGGRPFAVSLATIAGCQC